MPVALRPAVALSIAVLALWGCDTAPGFAIEAARPTLSALTVSPLDVALDTDAPTASIPLTVAGTLQGDGPAEVRVLVRYVDTDSLVTETAQEVAPGAFSLDVPVVLPRGAVGDYAVTVSTEGPDGRGGDRAAAVLSFRAANLGGPSVTVAPVETVTRPTGVRVVNVEIIATTSDPDGRENIAAVVVQVPEADGGGVLGRLFDDGGGSDDDADDGVFSGAIRVTSDFEPGTYTLEVVAIDRAGEISEPAPFSFEVRP